MVKKKRCENRRRRRKSRGFPALICPPKCCHRQRPEPGTCPIPHCIDPIHPVHPIDPPKDPSSHAVEKECCGNILVQGKQHGFPIWETDVELNTTMVQVSIYSNPASTEDLKVAIDGEERKHFSVPPGNTTTFIGQGIKLITISSQGNEFTYVEGKYVISMTLHLHVKSAIVNER